MSLGGGSIGSGTKFNFGAIVSQNSPVVGQAQYLAFGFNTVGYTAVINAHMSFFFEMAVEFSATGLSNEAIVIKILNSPPSAGTNIDAADNVGNIIYVADPSTAGVMTPIVGGGSFNGTVGSTYFFDVIQATTTNTIAYMSFGGFVFET